MPRKRKGDSAVVGGMIVTMLTLIIIITAVFAYASWQSQLEKNYEIDLVLHKYLVEMESIDFSDQSAIDDLYNRLEAELVQHHVTGINFEGSTRSPVDTGEKITLRLRGSMEISYVSMPQDGGLASAFTIKDNVHVDITKGGTAMY